MKYITLVAHIIIPLDLILLVIISRLADYTNHSEKEWFIKNNTTIYIKTEQALNWLISIILIFMFYLVILSYFK